VASRAGIRSRLCLFLFQRANEVWLQSDVLAQQLRRELETRGDADAWRRIEPRLRIVSNGLELPAPRELALPEANRFVFVGRLSPEKDFDTLFAAVARHPAARLAIIGDGPLLPRLRAQADATQVTFLGAQDRQAIDAQLRRSRGLILCSTVEGLPNAILEALAQGCPVIGTAVGAIPEVLTDGGNGYLVQPGDREAIAEAMRKLQDDQRWLLMAAQARQSVERFSWSKLVPMVEAHLAALQHPVDPVAPPLQR
jgi:glycosyltransferase involved in cell wall biosynthesis